jgi:uncharacterized membrane protein
MITPTIMLVIMTAPWLAVRSLGRPGSSEKHQTAGAVGLGMLFVFTGAGHFLQTEAMAEMLLPFVPARVPLVYATGLLEWAIALGFFVPRWRFAAGVVAATVLIAFFPANVYAAFAHVPFGGHEWGPVYLLIRAPLQLAIILWTWRFAIWPGLQQDQLSTFGRGSWWRLRPSLTRRWRRAR